MDLMMTRRTEARARPALRNYLKTRRRPNNEVFYTTATHTQVESIPGS